MSYQTKGQAKQNEENVQILNKINYHPNLEESTNCFSIYSFFYTNSIIRKALRLKKKNEYLTENDLHDCRSFLKPEVQQKQIQEFNKTSDQLPIHPKIGSKRKLTTILGKILNKEYRMVGFLANFANLLQFGGPIFLKQILEYLEDEEAEVQEGYIWAAGVFLCFFIKIFITQRAFQISSDFSIKLQNGTSGTLLEKILKLSSASKKYYEPGTIMNYITVDQQNIFILSQMCALFMSSPLTVIVAIALICVELGGWGLLTPLLFLISFSFQGRLQAMFGKIGAQILQFKDKRAKMVYEFFTGIRIIKYYAWEEIVSKKVLGIRAKESEQLMKNAKLRTKIEEMSNFTPILISITIFSIYVAAGNELKPSKAYSVLALFNLVVIPFRLMIFSLIMYIQTKISMKRLDHFLDAEDIKEDTLVEDKSLQQGEIKINDGIFAWENVTALEHSIKGKPVPRKKKPATKKEDKKTKKENQPKQDIELQKLEKGQKPQNEQQTPEEEKKIDPVQQLKNSDLTVLKNINFTAKKGELIGVIGLIASGKSSFLHALLGEMEKTNGSVKKNGSVAYVSQTAWLQNESLRNNILFGSEYNKEKYQNVLKICELQSDIDILPGGDQVEIGERGINLSGGQKQRIQIARAVYAEADIYLIDDCLSALDAHVGKNIFKNVIQGALKDKTVIFVTHALQYMPLMSKIVVFDTGTIAEQGTYQELSTSNSHFKTLQVQLKSQEKKEKTDVLDENSSTEEISENSNEDKKSHPTETVKINSNIDTTHNKHPHKNIQDMQKSVVLNQDKQKQEEIQKIKDGALVQKEERAVGSVPLRIYLNYISSGGICTTILVVSTLFLAQFCRIAIDWWIGQWGEDKFDMKNSEYIYIYAGIGIFCAICYYTRGQVFSYFTVKSADTYQKKLIEKLLHTPMQWFDITPTGRIITRITKDQEEIDSKLPFSLSVAAQNTLLLICTVILIGIILPYTFIVAFVGLICFYKIVSYYLTAAREIKRIETNSKSPILSNFQEAISGTYIIRAFKKEQFFIEKYLYYQHKFAVGNANYNYTQRWISCMTDLFAVIIISSTCFFAVFSKDSDYISDPALMGLAISQSFQIIIILSFTLKMIADTESQMNALVRMLQYIDDNPTEKDWYTPVKQTEKNSEQQWPQKGQFEVQNITYKYRPNLPEVIHGISLNIQPSEKIGIVGRTGSGKSTMTLGLMRILELAADQKGVTGHINLDGQDISEVGLHVLRDKVTIIPQDPVLFTGSLKFNIDPFEKYPRETLISSLKQVKLWDQFEETLRNQRDPKNQNNKKNNQNSDIALKETEEIKIEDDDILNLQIDEGGENFSLGQRQLICMARALIRKPKVLLLDEATASIDEKTDHFIQQMIKTAFKDTTVITIAHRINTIMQYDKIVVLEQGNIVELDTPLNLVNKNNGLFASLVNEGGDDFRQKMIYLAQNRDEIQ